MGVLWGVRPLLDSLRQVQKIHIPLSGSDAPGVAGGLCTMRGMYVLAKAFMVVCTAMVCIAIIPARTRSRVRRQTTDRNNTIIHERRVAP